MTALGYFTVVSHRLSSIEADYVDAGMEPDEDIIYSFVDFVPREKPGTVHWLSGLTPPRGIQLDTIRARYSPEDGKLRNIVNHPTNEKQAVTVTGTPFTLSYSGTPTASLPSSADPGAVQVALAAIPAIGEGNVYVYRVPVNEKQTVTIEGGPTGGTFPLAFGGPSTIPISRNAGAAAVQSALQSLTAIGSSGCSVTGPTGGPWVVEFTGPLAATNVALLTANSAGLTPTGTVTVVTTVSGSSTAPYYVNFIGDLAGTDVPQLTATNATVSTATPGSSAEGVMLVANTPVMEIDGDLIYDVRFTVPDLDPLKEDRVISPFGITAPTVAGTIVDLADAELHVPPKAL